MQYKSSLLINFWISNFQCGCQVHRRTLIGPQVQSFEASEFTLWIWAYICTLDCIKMKIGSDTCKWVIFLVVLIKIDW